jgi:4-amino-4-deoxy-L-arabinose transferase-like glycosyltransferase
MAVETAADETSSESAVDATLTTTAAASPTSSSPGRRRALHRPSPQGWVTGVIGLATAVFYTWNLSAVGNANSFYAAAVKSGSVSWKAWFFASIDPGSFITVDKPPGAMWIQGLSARLFGFSTWSMILPEVLMGVGSVLILHHLVCRWKGDTAAHLAAVALATTPIATAMFRNNNPDAFLTFLGLAAAWALWNAIESGRTRPLLVAAALVGLAFNTKMLQAFLVLPAMAAVYLVAGPAKFGRRFAQLVMAMGVLIVSAGWFSVVVALWPAADRPYIGSTSDNSIFSLMLGYNGLDRVFGGSGGNATGGAGFGGTPGLWRMLDGEVGGQVGWLLPLAAAGLVAGLWLRARCGRTDRQLAGWLLWGGWALTCIAVFSFSQGIFHPYYTVQLAPAIAALAGAGAVTLWELGRRYRLMTFALPLAIAMTAGIAVGILRRTPAYHPDLRNVIIGLAAAAIAGLVAGTIGRARWLVIGSGTLAAVALLVGPTAYSVTTLTSPVDGSLITAGPASGTGLPGLLFGARGTPRRSTAETEQQKTLITFLESHRGRAAFIVAAISSSATEDLIIHTGKPVMTIGGFNGGDPAPTLAEFEGLVTKGAVRYLLAGNSARGGRPSSNAIVDWAQQHGTVITVGSETLYDLAPAKKGDAP